MPPEADDGFTQPSSYVPTFTYSDQRRFESPRVQVPPPNLNYRNGKPAFHVPSLPFEQISTQYGNPNFLKALTLCHKLDMVHTMLSWQYTMRRTAQAILPFLFLGPSSAARDTDFVNRTGVTLLVAVRSLKTVEARPSFLDPATFASGSEASTLTFDFATPYDFIAGHRPIIRAINDHLEASCTRRPLQSVDEIRGKVLIFCESGNDRSSVLVAAYLMVVYGVSVFTAINIIQSQRFSITMSDEMKKALLDLQEIVSAERQIADSKNAAGSPTVPWDQCETETPVSLPLRPGKRNLDQLYNPDEEMGYDPSNAGAPGTREGIAPFTDAVDHVR